VCGICEDLYCRENGEIEMIEAALMLNGDKTKLVKAKYRNRLHHRGRLTNRIFCLKSFREREVGNLSFDECKKPCEFAAKIEENGVWCSFGQEEQNEKK
jgi:hypothetical protein